MSGAQHTPGLVKVGRPHKWYSRCMLPIVRAEGAAVQVATIFCRGPEPTPEDLADAERIVQCLNAHDELVLALIKLADAVETSKPEHAGYLALCAQEARAAIAKATGSHA